MSFEGLVETAVTMRAQALPRDTRVSLPPPWGVPKKARPRLACLAEVSKGTPQKFGLTLIAVCGYTLDCCEH